MAHNEITWEPAFPERLRFVRPAVPSLDRVTRRLDRTYSEGWLTNGPLVEELEHTVAQRLGVKHVVGVASCTTGLILALQALDVRGPALVPSFTFCATAHAAVWNHLDLQFVDCDPATFSADLAALERNSPEAGAILVTHVFGAPCSPAEVEAIGRRSGIPVVFDAAHGFGAMAGGRPVGGFGDAEVFSLTPTKPLVAGEGGLVCTNRDDVAEWARIGRDYGNPGDYNTLFVGLNARMSELHAAVALESLVDFDVHLARRRELAGAYRALLAQVPGTTCQVVTDGDLSTYKDFGFLVDAETFGMSRDDVVAVLDREGIDTRCYFSPPVHRQKAYAEHSAAELPVTDDIAGRIINLPIFPGLPIEDLERVVEVIARSQAAASRAG